MKTCLHCHLTIANDLVKCPLCGKTLAGDSKGCSLSYPRVENPYMKYHFFIRLAIFVSILAAVVSLVVNLLAPHSILWSVIVILGIGYSWISTMGTLKRRHNIGLNIFIQVLCLSVFIPMIDFLTVKQGWSFDYVLPFLDMAGIAGIVTAMLIQHKNKQGYIIYLVATAVLGVIPVILLLTGLANVLWPSLAAALCSGFTILGLFIFGDRGVITELKKRFHV